MDILYTQPVSKKNYYITKTNKNIFYDIIDIKIKLVTKLNDGYLFSIYINDNDKIFFNDIDNIAIQNLITYNSSWFLNELTENDIKTLYKPSFCSQNNSISLYLTSNTKIFYNNKLCEVPELLSKINKKYIINIKIQLIGMYIYSNKTFNKWHIHTLNIYDDVDDNIEDENKEEIEEYWKESIDECNKILDKKIKNINTTKENIQKLYSEIITTKKSIIWENKISELKKLVQNIIF